jgi:hypothetical protein
MAFRPVGYKRMPDSFEVALRPTESPRNFEAPHACDPNVIRAGGRYYLYYGGAGKDGAVYDLQSG